MHVVETNNWKATTTTTTTTTTKTFIHPAMFYIKHGDDIYIDKYYSLVFT